MKPWIGKTMAVLAVLAMVAAVFAALPAKADQPAREANASATASIYGYVTAGTGSVDGIGVQLYDIFNNNVTATTQTVNGGGFSFGGIAAGYYHIRIASQEIGGKVYFGTMTDNNPAWAPRVESGAVRWANFTLQSQEINAHLVGTVTDDETPAASIGGATVRIWDMAHNYFVTATTDANGTFDIDFYAGTFGIDIMGTGAKSEYSYEGAVTLSGDGETSAMLDNTASGIIKNADNPKAGLKVYVNGKSLVEDEGFYANYTSGEVTFWDAGNGYLTHLRNRDIVTAHYHYNAGPATWTKFSDSLTDSWNESPVLYFAYGHISNVVVKKNGATWTQPSNGTDYVVDAINGTLTLNVNSTITLGDRVSARYDTVEKETAWEQVLVSGANKKTFPLGRHWIEGYALNETMQFITAPMYVSLYDTNESKMLTASTAGGTNYFTISVPQSKMLHKFTLVVHPDGFNPYTKLNFFPAFGSDGRYSLGQLQFTKSDKELFQTSFEIKDTLDWNNITVGTNNTWTSGSSFPGIGNETLGNIRFQIDLEFGNADGILQAAELAAFEAWLQKVTPNYVSTQSFLTLNGTPYISRVTGVDVKVADHAGASAPVDSAKSIEITTVVKAQATDADFNSPRYTAELNMNIDTAARNYTYMLELPKYFVRTSDNPDEDNIIMDGYTSISIDPKHVAGQVSRVVDMTLEMALNATPKASLRTWNGVDGDSNYSAAYKVPNVNYTYLVAKGKDVTYSAEDSIPAVGEIVGYYWDFGDGANSGWVENVTATHAYAAAKANMTVKLSVKNSLGNVTVTNASTSLMVSVDATAPDASFVAFVNKSHTDGTVEKVTKKDMYAKADLPAGYCPLGTKTVVTWANEAIIFNGSASSDGILAKAAKDGTIRHWNYDFGNKSSSGNLTNGYNYTFAGYPKAGMYNVTLNVTDVVGWYTAYKITVVVKSSPGFWQLDSARKNQTTMTERTKYFFDANVSAGPFSGTIASYKWTFEFLNDKTMTQVFDGKRFVEFTFAKNGAWNVTLNTTDVAGNWARNTTKLVIQPGPHPDIAVMSIQYSITTPEEDSEVIIEVNITNQPGQKPANATNVVVKAYDDKNKNYKAEASELIGLAYQYNGTSGSSYSLLKPKQWVVAKIKWKPSGSFEHLVLVNVTCNDELASTMYNNVMNKTVFVNPAKWKTYALVGGTILAIVLAIVLIYAWKTGKFSGYKRRRAERLEYEKQKGREMREKLSKEKDSGKDKGGGEEEE